MRIYCFFLKQIKMHYFFIQKKDIIILYHVLFYIFAKKYEICVKMNKIKLILDRKGIKQTWLAGQLGKSYNMINSYAQNRSQPNLETLYKIASILNVEIEELLCSKEEVENEQKQNF